MTGPDESPSRIEPCLLDRVGPDILDLVTRLAAEASRLGERLHPRTAMSLADAVRLMNCYYSNLIEGHNTTPREIAAALTGAFAGAEARRNLQIEARSHIRVQRDIDRMHATGNLPDPASIDFIQWLHARFYDEAPPATLSLREGTTELVMTPGTFRHHATENVTVGRHQPPSPAAVSAFMAYFEQRYRRDRLGAGSRVLALAAAHHRLNYIHPFLDGNGRVSRLMSHAMALDAGIGAHGLWSVSRGLARGLESRDDYKRMMDLADTPRQGDLDGRGNLSRRALENFTAWFPRVCLDQVVFMRGMFGFDTLAGRLRDYAARRGWRPEAEMLLLRILQQGELPRGDAGPATRLGERRARDLMKTLTADGILASDPPKGPVSLRFPLHVAEAAFPLLFP